MYDPFDNFVIQPVVVECNNITGNLNGDLLAGFRFVDQAVAVKAAARDALADRDARRLEAEASEMLKHGLASLAHDGVYAAPSSLESVRLHGRLL